jgi:hypothetical protein
MINVKKILMTISDAGNNFWDLIDSETKKCISNITYANMDFYTVTNEPFPDCVLCMESHYSEALTLVGTMYRKGMDDKFWEFIINDIESEEDCDMLINLQSISMHSSVIWILVLMWVYKVYEVDLSVCMHNANVICPEPIHRPLMYWKNSDYFNLIFDQNSIITGVSAMTVSIQNQNGKSIIGTNTYKNLIKNAAPSCVSNSRNSSTKNYPHLSELGTLQKTGCGDAMYCWLMLDNKLQRYILQPCSSLQNAIAIANSDAHFCRENWHEKSSVICLSGYCNNSLKFREGRQYYTITPEYYYKYPIYNSQNHNDHAIASILIDPKILDQIILISVLKYIFGIGNRNYLEYTAMYLEFDKQPQSQTQTQTQTLNIKICSYGHTPCLLETYGELIAESCKLSSEAIDWLDHIEIESIYSCRLDEVKTTLQFHATTYSLRS